MLAGPRKNISRAVRCAGRRIIDGFLVQFLYQFVTVFVRPRLYVTSRNSSFAFKGKDLTAQQIAAKLEVRYLLEGSVQQDADRVRINVRLIDGGNGKHVWAEHYDRRDENLFALQDKTTMKILAALNIKVTGFKTGGLENVRPDNLEVYERFLKGLYYHLGRRRNDIDKARAAFEEAIHLDPEFAKAHYLLGLAYLDEITLRRTTKRNEFFEKAERMAKKAEELDPENPPSRLWSSIYREKKDHEKSILYAKKCVAQDPNDPYRYFFWAWRNASGGNMIKRLHHLKSR